MSQKKHKGFVEGALIIAAASILVKIIGAVFKIPLDRAVLQTDGMALYNTSYTIYNLLFVISTAGLPTAISKLVAESDSRGDYAGSEKILKVSFRLLFCLGAIGSLVLFFGAKLFSGLVGYPDAYLTMAAMSPSLLFVGCMSAFRGYFQGRQNMLPTAVSEVIEAFSKLFVGLGLAYLLLPKGKMYASAGAIFGVTAGSILGTVFLSLCYAKNRRRVKESDSETSSKEVLKSIVKIAVPITLGVSVFTLTSFIDTATVTNQLKGYISESTAARESITSNLEAGQSEKFLAIGSEALTFEKATEREAAFVYGYLVRAITLFNMPAVVIAAIATSVVPAIAAANAEKNRKKSRGFTRSALIIAIVLALPCAAGMSILARPILSLIYKDPSFSVLLNIMGVAVAFLTLVQIANALLQAWGKVWIPVFNMMVGGVLKVVTNLLLVGRPELNITGAPVGTLICYITVVVLDIIFIVKYSKIRFSITDFVIKPLFCTAFMGAFTFASYKALVMKTGDTVALICSIAVSALVYFAAIILTRTLKREEIVLLPKGERIASVMEKLRLL